jgi:hypothetical protein
MITVNDLQSRSFSELRDLLGYIENGGSTTVKIYQDDATGSWCIDVGDKHYYADSLQGVIRKAHSVHHELLDPI